MLGSSLGKAYALEQDVEPLLAGTKSVEPLVLHVNVGDCVSLELTNGTDGGPVSVHADMLAFDPSDSYGAAVGRNQGIDVAGGDAQIHLLCTPGGGRDRRAAA